MSESSANNRGLVRTITHTLSGSPQINVSFDYDAVGNRIFMSDSLGTVSYSYDQLSHMTSETRTLSGIGSFTLNYGYNVGGQLASFTSFGNTIQYTRDVVGRLSAVSGSPFGGVTQYVNNIKYRAWGGQRQVTYGNNHTASIQYNSGLLPTNYSLSNVMTRDYSYFADGQVRTSSFAEDQNFYRSYEYDQLGRLKSDSTPMNFSQTLTYDVWGNATHSDAWHWSRFIGFDGAYSNNRHTGWNYNAAGQVTFNGDNAFEYDAAGEIKQIWTQGGIMNGGAMSYDGDGQFVHSTNSFIYNIRSTVLGGRVVAEVLNNGQRFRGFVYAEGEEVLATQNADNRVLWEYRDAGDQSVRVAESSGAVVDGWDETSSGARIEKEDPYPSDPDFTGADTDGAYPHLGAIGKPITGCTRDGILIPDCGWIFERIHRTELYDTSARLSGWQFLNYSVLTSKGPLPVGDNAEFAIAIVRELGSDTLIRNWVMYGNSSLGSGFQDRLTTTIKSETWKAPPDAKAIQDNLTTMLKKEDCAAFVEQLLNQLSSTENPRFTGSVLDIFGKVMQQKKLIRGGLATKEKASAAVAGSLKKGNAAIYLGKGFTFMVTSLEDKAKAVAVLDAFNVLHELIHLAGQNDSYSDRQVAVALSIMGNAGLPIREKHESEREFIGRNSEYFTHILKTKCPPL